MDNSEMLDAQLTTIVENLKKLGDGNGEQLPSMEKYVQGEICALLDAEVPIREHWKHIFACAAARERNRNPQGGNLSGSLVEGAMMARCFQKKEDWKEVEIDFMVNLFTLSQQVSHLLEPVEDKPGFVRLPCHELYPVVGFQGSSTYVPFCGDQLPRYISPLFVKDHGIRNIVVGPLKHYTDELTGDTIYVNTSASKTETTVETRFDPDSSMDVSIRCHVNTDSVPSVKLLFWPHQAAAWITRRRHWWPPQNIIQSIADEGCQLVPRSSPGGDVHSEWRFSFSSPEAVLAQLRSKKLQHAYYFFKMFFYRYLKCVESTKFEGKPLYSYIIKTTMLWAFEELPPQDPIWTSLEKSVQMLLFKLLSSLEAGCLPHYFIPEINLLERVGEDVRIKCATIISMWLKDILMATPFDMPEKREFVKALGLWYERLRD